MTSSNTRSPWTPEDRNDWIELALNSENERGTKNGFHYSMMLKQMDNSSHPDENKRHFATASLATALYAKHPLFKRLSLCLYKALMQRISDNSFISLMHRKRNFVMMIKGSNAYKMLLRQRAQDIDYSDLDIIIFINPNLDDQMFEQLRSSISILITQVLSRFKKDLDNTLFQHETKVEETILRKDLMLQFKESYMDILKNEAFKEENQGVILSPFENEHIRNMCSKRSFVILESEAKSDHVVRIEIPHFDKCEYIPLRKTPLVISHNRTIRFDRDVEGTLIGEFELFRIRLNNVFIPDEHVDESSDTCSDVQSEKSAVSSETYHKHTCKIIPADFIDINIPSKRDAELLDFWNTGGFKRCYEVFDKCVGANIMIPNVNECIRDLDNMLHKYTNTSLKIEKRKKRLELFRYLDEERKKQWEVQTNTVSSTEN